jgi:N-acetylmuramoyl-L-alanine amidase
MTKIFVDPGHGGTDPGAVGNGLLEKNITLAISKKIRDFLTDYENVQVRLSREGDQTLALKQRTDMANAWGADFLLSIHINAFNGKACGYEDFIFPGSGGASSACQNVIHEEIMKQVDFINRGKKQGNLHMLRESEMPALLTENGFIDHAGDASKLKQPAYIERIARGHVNGLVKAFGLKKNGGIVMVNQKLTPEQEKIRQEAIRLRITDGKDPFDEINRVYLWSAMIPLARRVEDLEKKVK